VSSAIAAQQVALPTVRTVGPTPATRQLVSYVDALDNWYRPATAAESAAQAVLDYVRFRALLAPFEAPALSNIAHDPRMARLWSELYKRDGASVAPDFFPAATGMVEQVRNRILLLAAVAPPPGGGAPLSAVLSEQVASGLQFVERQSSDSQAALARVNLVVADSNLATAARVDSGAARDEAISATKWRLSQAVALLDAAVKNANAAATQRGALGDADGRIARATIVLMAAAAKARSAAEPIASKTDAEAMQSARAVVKSARTEVDSARGHLAPAVTDTSHADSLQRLRVRSRASFDSALFAFAGPDFEANVRAPRRLEPVEVVGKTPQSLDTSVSTVKESDITVLANALQAFSTDQKLIGKLDTLARLAELVVIERTIDARHYFPVRTTEEARVFWRQEGASPLNLGYAGISSTSASAMMEIAAPLLHFLRLSLNTTVAAHSDAQSSTAPSATEPNPSDATALTQFLTGGGQFNLAAAVPVVSFQHRQAAASALLLFSPRLGGTLSTLGTVHEDPSAFADIGMDAQLTWADVVERVGLVGQVRLGVPTMSSTQATALGLPKSFGYATWTAGMIFNERFVLSVGRAAAGPAVLNRVKAQIGVTVVGAPK
jgi:hypothetical protein